MSSWWRRYAETLSNLGEHGSWKRRAAEALGASGSPWARAIAEESGNIEGPGSWTRRTVRSEHPQPNAPWSAQLTSVAPEPDYLHDWIGAATYADYDASKIDRLFQESTGQTAVSASGNPLGLMLEGAQWGGRTLAEEVSGQAELNNDPLIQTPGIWTTGGGSGISISVGSISWSAAVNGVSARPSTQSIIGKWYIAEFTVVSISQGAVGVALAGSGVASPGTYRQIIGPITHTNNLYLRCYGETTAVVSKYSIKEIPGFHGLNATSAQRLTYQVSGTRRTVNGDGAADNLLTTWLAASGGNTVFFDVNVPETLSATLMFFGSQEISPLNRFWGAFNPSGQLSFGIGQTIATGGSVDYRGKRCVGALSHDGSVMKIFTLDGEVDSRVQDGIPTTTVPARIAASNANGSAGAFWSGGISRIIPVHKGGLTLEQAMPILNQLAALNT